MDTLLVTCLVVVLALLKPQLNMDQPLDTICGPCRPDLVKLA